MVLNNAVDKYPLCIITKDHNWQYNTRQIRQWNNIEKDLENRYVKITALSLSCFTSWRLPWIIFLRKKKKKKRDNREKRRLEKCRLQYPILRHSRTSTMELFPEIRKSLIVDVWLGSKYASAIKNQKCHIEFARANFFLAKFNQLLKFHNFKKIDLHLYIIEFLGLRH